MTEIEANIGPISGKLKTTVPVIFGLKPCVPAIKISERLLRPDDMVSFHADPDGTVTATRIHATEDGKLVRG
ncbi:MAG: hypothetical protein OXU85_01565 [Thaumarchaeota archaeon]|nr:hypothetical protein [Nitrososphaerota archaeon]